MGDGWCGCWEKGGKGLKESMSVPQRRAEHMGAGLTQGAKQPSSRRVVLALHLQPCCFSAETPGAGVSRARWEVVRYQVTSVFLLQLDALCRPLTMAICCRVGVACPEVHSAHAEALKGGTFFEVTVRTALRKDLALDLSSSCICQPWGVDLSSTHDLISVTCSL